MFHGGLRYLEQLEFGLVREALHERELSLTTLAPHLVKLLPFLFLLTHRVGAALHRCGHLPLRPAGRAKSVPAQRHLTRAGALRLAPSLKRGHRRRHPLLRHGGRRRPAHHDGGPHRGPLRAVVRTSTGGLAADRG